MKKILLLLLAAVLSTCVAFAQTRVITGRLLDAQTKEPLIGATVAVKGTTVATSVALDGSFKLRVPSGDNTLVMSFIGYVSKEVSITSARLGTILLDPTAASIKEVTVTASQSLAIDRQTPIAASSVNSVFIEEKGAGAEFPELIKSTPGVMVTRGGGGYGDSRVNIRGFSSNNVALLINGIPANDVEAGKLYWNDWAGLADVTTLMQTQRGLGASKVAVPSLGGTININTRSTEATPAGAISQSIGSYGAMKTAVSYSTGLNDKGWGASFLLSKSQGDGNAEGLFYTGYSYFANVSKLINKSQSLSFTILGAAQRHGQRYTYNTINTYRAAPQGTRYNSDYGYLNGQIYSAEQNYYNKPLASVNHNWTINDKSSLSTIVYGSWGDGAANYLAAANPTLTGYTLALGGTVPRTGNAYSPIDFNAITKANMANADGSSTNIMQNSVNNHAQYGVLSTYKRKVAENLTLLAGIDGRYYQGEHYYQVDNLLGGNYIVDVRSNSATSPYGNINNPGGHITTGGKYNSDYLYQITSEGGFAQLEYATEKLSAFVTGALNNTSNQRTDYFNYLDSDPNRKSKSLNFLGYQAKGGANYNLDNQNNVFVNIGYIQRAPLVASLFFNKKNDINPDARPEKLLSYELGYGYRSSIFSANVNLYRSTYKDRSKVQTLLNSDNTLTTINLTGLNELHQGVEIDAKFRPVKDVTLSGMLSVNDYHYTSNTGAVQATNDKGQTTTQSALLLKDLKIGEFGTANTAAQTTAALGLDVKVLPQLKIGGNYNYYSRYYASFDPTKLTTDNFPASGVQFSNYAMPDFSTVDLNVVFRFKFAGLDASFIGNVYNLLNTTYLADGFETAPQITAKQDFVARTGQLGVWYGPVRTYVTTLKIKF